MITFLVVVFFIGALVWSVVAHITRKKTFMERGGTIEQWGRLMKEEAAELAESMPEPESEAEKYYRRHNRDGT